ncbi:hypothetical protein VTK56DRAFT_362 [Thermocarpiscus australiensis]
MQVPRHSRRFAQSTSRRGMQPPCRCPMSRCSLTASADLSNETLKALQWNILRKQPNGLAIQSQTPKRPQLHVLQHHEGWNCSEKFKFLSIYQSSWPFSVGRRVSRKLRLFADIGVISEPDCNRQPHEVLCIQPHSSSFCNPSLTDSRREAGTPAFLPSAINNNRRSGSQGRFPAQIQAAELPAMGPHCIDQND